MNNITEMIFAYFEEHAEQFELLGIEFTEDDVNDVLAKMDNGMELEKACDSVLEGIRNCLDEDIEDREMPWDYGKHFDDDNEPDLVLETADLYSLDEQTGNIKVDKQIFDDYVPNSYINILFCDSNNENVISYRMIAETDEYIEMEFIG